MEQLRAFIEKIESDNELKAKVEVFVEKANQPDEIITIAAEYGFIITADDLDNFSKHKELNKEELEEVVGGSPHFTIGDKNISRADKCWFVPTGKIKTGLAQCGSFCGLYTKCGCYAYSVCVDKWHKIEDTKYLSPFNDSNHAKKHPPSYND